ncbi:MAG: hypothetical protein R6V19_01480, partial [Armatimonadota bacterium]
MTNGAAESNSAHRIDLMSRILGILVFVAGIVMIIMVFVWAHDLVVSMPASMLTTRSWAHTKTMIIMTIPATKTSIPSILDMRSMRWALFDS